MNRSSWKDIVSLEKLFSPTLNTGLKTNFEIPVEVPNSRFPTEPKGIYNFGKLDVSQRIHTGYAKQADGSVRAPKPGAIYRSKVTEIATGKHVYDVHYSFDEFGRRNTPHTKFSSRKKHAIFFGCSATFGEGVEDGETLPAAFASSAPSYRAYNLGFSGAGPNQILERIRTTSFLSGIKEREGVGIYVFITAHVERVLGRMNLLATWYSSQAYATEDEDGEIQVEGTFASERPYLVKFYELFWKTEFRKFFKIDWPPIFEEDLEFFAKIVLAIKQEYQKQTGSNEFYVVIKPGQTSFANEIKREFEKLQIKYLDYSGLDLSTTTEKPIRIWLDGHPNAEANRLTGELIARALGVSDSISKHRK